VSGVGGSINVANSGVIGNDSGLQAIYAASGASAYSSSSDTSSDAGVTTTTNNSASSIAGGTVDVAVNAGGSNGAVTAAGVDGASVTIDGAVGSVDQASSVSASSQFGTSADSNTMVSSADTYHYEDHSSTATVGGDASVAIGASGSVSGNVASNGFTSASVTVDGTVGADGDNRTVSANSAGVATTYDSIVDVDYTNGDTSSSNTSGYERTGGDASVAVGANGVIHGSVNAQGDGSATVSNGGLITGPVVANSAIYTQTGSHSASSNSSTSASSGSVSSSESSYGYEYQTLGGTASVVNAAGATIEGNTSATGISGASIENAGTLESGAYVSAVGSDSSYQQANSSTSTFRDSGSGAYLSKYETTSSSQSTGTAVGGDASLGNANGSLIDGSVQLAGLTAAKVDNSGRINGSVSISARGIDSSSDAASQQTTTYDETGAVLTQELASTSNSAQTAAGGTASFTNASTGLVVGSIQASGDAGVEIDNQGAVTGTTYANSQRNLSASSTDNSSSYALGADGSETISSTSTGQFTTTVAGGDVNGIYAGTNGAYQYTPTGASDGSVTQIAAGNSAAAVTGTIIGSFSGEAVAYETSSVSVSTSNEVYTPATADAVSSDVYSSETNSESATSFRPSTSSLAVNGGRITGNADLRGSGGASAELGNGGAIDGSVFLSAQYADTTSSATNSSTDTYADGQFVSCSDISHTESTEEAGSGAVSLTMADASIGGSASLFGSAGETILELTSESEIGGSADLYSSVQQASSSSDDVRSSTASGSTQSYSTETNFTSSGGNVTANVDGVIGTNLQGALAYGSNGGNGDLGLFTSKGDATAAVTGQVGDSIHVNSAGYNSSDVYTSDYVNGSQTSYSASNSYTATGGAASLVLDSAAGQVPVNFGDITVSGFAGSTLDVSADSIAAARQGSTSVYVGYVGADSMSSNMVDVDGATASGSSTEVAVGGAASLTNAGQIGYADANYMGTGTQVEVESVVDASALNSGSIFGSIYVGAIGEVENGEFSSVNIGDVNQVTTNTITHVPYGGSATLLNDGLITGDAELGAAEGALTNNGVIRGDVALGQSVENYVTQSVDTFVQIGEAQLLETQPLFAQNYTVNQNGALGGVITVGGAFGDIEVANGNPVMTSDVQATVNLNEGSVTLGGVYADFDQETGDRFTTTDVNLVDNGFLGIDLNALDEDTVNALAETFSAVDPAIDASLFPAGYVAGARVQGVENLTKTGAGTFSIVGADLVPATNLNPLATYTLDVGTFAVNEGEVQLATANDGVFGIRGDLVNNASLVLGTRVAIPQTLFASNLTNQGVEGVDGVSLYQLGNFTQTETGSLTVGIMPTLVRVVDPSVGDTVGSNEPLGVGNVQYGQGLFTTPEQAYGAAYGQLAPSSATIDGNLTLAGTIDLVAPTGGLFLDGQSLDLFSVSGEVDHTAASVDGAANNFVTFDLVDTTDGDRTIVSVVASRAGYETAANNSNAAAAGAALTAALPSVADALVADANNEAAFTSVEQFSLTQDLATVMAGLDSRLTMEGAAAALDELGTGSYYGSITSLRTTAPFADVLTSRRLPESAKGFNLWMQPSGDFSRISGSSSTGARKIHADNYGGSAGFGVSTGSGEFGLGFGYGEIHSNSSDSLAKAKAKTWMAGIYGRQGFGPLTVAADLVLGWSNWDATRAMPTLARDAEASFDSKEVRADLRAEYAFDLGAAKVSPYAQLELRHYNFDGFAEEGAGGVGLAVDGKSKSVLTPTLGVKAEGSFETEMATLRPMVAISYSFKDNNNADRTVAFLGAPDETFRLKGVDQKGFVTLQGGLFADIGGGSGAFLNGSYSTGGGNNSAGVKAGVIVGF